MAKYIDAEKLKRLLLRRKFTGKDIDGHEMSFNDGIFEAIFAIDKITVADVAPIKHGHWYRSFKRPYEVLTPSGDLVRGDITAWLCSNCKGGSIWKGLYCPNCGARMDGKDGDGNDKL